MKQAATISILTILFLTPACQPVREAPEAASQTPPPAAGPVKPAECPPPGTCPGSSCLDSISFAATTVPVDACPRHGESQIDVDIFSWNEFIALNWPADVTSCVATNQKSIVDVRSGDGTVAVWQTYMPAERVFVDPATSKPAAWCSGNGLSAEGMREMPHIAKGSPAAARLGSHFTAISQPGGDVLEAEGGVLTDHGLKDGKGGRWVRYERLMNFDEYQTITSQGWWNKAGLTGKKVVLPVTPTGALEIKSAWKVLTPDEISGGRYFTTNATVYNTPGGAPSPGQNPVTLGLVGLHLIHKTQTATNFFWSTFEHVDNDTVFFDPKSNAAPNTQTARQPYVELNPDGTPRNPGIQAKRTHPITGPEPLNRYYQQLLGESVFSNYRLISTQWTTGGAPQGTPPWVANLTLETYVQDLSVANGATQLTGCFACHMKSQTSIGTDGDHSYLFLEAK